nr:fibronectin type III domain-containing protein [Candidatus Neomarinimicrobiota bacterium]
ISGNTEDTIDSTLQFIGLTFIRGRSSDNGGSFNIQAENYYDSGTNKSRATLMQPKFKDCIFKDNRADGGNNGSLGGAFHISDGAPIFENCVFDSNYSNNGGGAINITGNNQNHRDILWFRDCTFKNNRADDAGLSQGGGGNTNWGVRGGAVWLGFGMDISFINCVFENNEAVELNRNDGVYGGALSISQQWAHEVDPMVRIYNSRFTNNVTRQEASGGAQSHGGAIYAGAPFTMVNSLVDSNRAAFESTNGTGRGGGLYIDGQTHYNQGIDGNEIFAKSILVNNTIVDNYANGGSGAPYSGEGGGIFLDRSNEQRGVWFNNIIWGNRTANTTDTFWHNMNPVNSDQFKIDTDYNDLEFSEHYPYFMGSNSYDVDPAFYSATNYQLSTGSPLIGAGATSFYGSSAPLVDILGNVRPNPAGSNPDLGAYENSLAESPYPKQVKNLVGVFGSRQVSLSWDANTETDIKKYLVYMSTTMDFEPTPADSVDETTATSYTVTGLTNKTEYHFRIAAVDSSGYRGTFSDQVSVTPEYLGPNWWVSVQNGSDDTGDGSIELPFSSIQWALKETSHADTIRIMPGTYYEHSFSNYDPQSTQPQSTGRFDLTIVGMNSTGEVIVDAQKNNRHMMINGGFTPDMQISMTFRNIHFTNGEGRDEDGFSGGGSMYLAKITAKFVNCHFSNNQATAGVGGWSPGGAINIYSSTVKIISCTFEDNFSQIRGGAINIDWYDENDEVDVEIINSTFTRNDVQINDGEQMSALGGAIYFGGSRNLRLKIQDSIFSDNRVRNNNSGQGCAGGVIGSMGQDPQDDWSNIEPVIIDRNIFMDNGCDCGPGTWAGGSVIDVGWNIDIS